MSGRRRRIVRPRLALFGLVLLAALVLVARAARAPSSPARPRHDPTRTAARHAPPPPALPVPLSGLALAAADGRLWAVGGLVRGTTSTDAVYAWRPGQKAWHLVAHLPAPRHDGAAAAVGGRVWFVGGGLGSVSAAGATAIAPAGGRAGVRALPPLPSARSDLCALAWRGGLLVAGGYDGVADSLSILALDPGARAWRTVASLRQGVRYTAAAALGDRLYLFGGLEPQGLTDAIWRVDLATGAVRRVGTLPVAADYMTAAVLGGRIYVLGGASAAGDLGGVWRFDPASGRLARVGRLPSPRAYGAAAVLGGRIYYAGGVSAGRALSEVAAVRPTGR